MRAPFSHECRPRQPVHFVDYWQRYKLLQLKKNIEYTEVHGKAPVQKLGDWMRI